MSSHSLAACALASGLAVIGLLSAPLERRAYQSDRGPRRKLVAYGLTIAVMWILTAAAIFRRSGVGYDNLPIILSIRSTSAVPIFGLLQYTFGYSLKD